jgi:hypothetical protein
MQAVATTAAQSAARKIETGSLMTLSEVAAKLSVAPVTVHRLPLPSVRVGRSLRFDPQDVLQLIQACKEATIAPAFGIAPAPFAS